MQLFEQFTLNEVEYKQYKNVNIIPPKEFEKYKKELEKKNEYVSIIKNTKLKTIEHDEIEDYQSVLKIENRYYELTTEKNKTTAGYIALGHNRFIRVTKMNLIFIIWLLMGIAAISLLYLLIDKPVGEGPHTPDNDGIDIDESATDWVDDDDTDSVPKEQESIVLPGFHKFTATSQAHDIELYNPPQNSVYFVYSIYNILGTETMGNFTTEEEAKKWIADNSTDSTESNEKGVNYTISKINDSSFDIIAEEYVLVKSTGMIEPGKKVMWNCYESLGVGEFDLKFKVSTYDIATGSACDGAVYKVHGVITK